LNCWSAGCGVVPDPAGCWLLLLEVFAANPCSQIGIQPSWILRK
jgi:hypothetical protein